MTPGSPGTRGRSPRPVSLLSRHGRPLAIGDDSSAGKALAQAPESDDTESSIGLAALPKFRMKGTC